MALEPDACRSRVVLLSGEAVPISPPAGQQGEQVLELRVRVAKALGVEAERVVLVAGSKLLQSQWEAAEVLKENQGSDLTVMISEDMIDMEDPQNVAEYASEIYRKLHHQDRADGLLASQTTDLATPGASESTPSPGSAPTSAAGRTLPGLMRGPELLTPPKRLRGDLVDRTSRCVLMDWLVEEHHKLELRSETLFLAVRLIDRFLLRYRVATRDLKLVGAAGLLIAAKFEEIYPPEIRDLVYVTHHEYTVEDVKRMEVLILSVLEFCIAGETAAHFMDRYLRANQCQELEGRLARYILELTLVDDAAIQRSPSILAAAAVLLVNRLSGRLPIWPAVMVNYTEQQEEALRPCACELSKLLKEARHSTFQCVRSKLLKDPPLFDLVKMIEASVE